MNPRDMVAAAIGVTSKVDGQMSCYLRVLCAAGTQAIEEFASLGRLSTTTVVDLSTQLGLPEFVIENIFQTYVRHDLVDYAELHASLCAHYLSLDNDLKSDALKWLKSNHQEDCIVFLLHNLIWEWDPETLSLTNVIIEDNEIANACKGLLVHAGLAFVTVVALLDVARRERWNSWRALWTNY